MYCLEKTEVVPLTRPLVTWFTNLPAYKGDRLRDSAAGRRRIAFLGRLLEEGKFHTPKWATAELDGKIYRVNGGHSSKMLSERNGDFPARMSAVLDQFKCEKLLDLADLFDQFDRRQSTRSSVDKVRAHKSAHAGLDEFSATDVDIAVRGIAYFLTSDGEEPVLKNEERIRLIHTHEEYLRWACQFTGCRRFNISGVAGAMYATWMSNPRAAGEFWVLVRDESHPDRENGSRKLATFLRENITRGVKNSKWSARAFYCKSITAWNAWRTKMPTQLKYSESSPWPSVR